jgi:hypothetical protein
MPISSAFSSAVDSSASGQPGNALPLNMPGGSSDVKVLDFGLMAGFHRPINLITISSVAAVVGSSMSGSLIYYQGLGATVGGAARITLPDPQPGLWFEFYGLGALGASAVTGYNAASATGCFAVVGDTACDGVLLSATTMDDEAVISFIGISTATYIASFRSNSSIGSSVHHLDASS